jgi:tRNA (mo5U34)-methyltransferase
VLEAETAALNLPSTLRGLTVLDIGAWDGYFSFEMERREAESVTSLDYYVWAINLARYADYRDTARRSGEELRPAEEVPGAWDPINLPGRAGFDLARDSRHSKVKSVVGDFMTVDLNTLGEFDVVLFLGVLYHLQDPFAALRRLRQVTRGLAVIETAAVVLPRWMDHRLWMFVEGTELNGDPTNWWVPTSRGLSAMCRAAGFYSAKVVLEPPEFTPTNSPSSAHFGRITMHAYAQSGPWPRNDTESSASGTSGDPL